MGLSDGFGLAFSFFAALAFALANGVGGWARHGWMDIIARWIFS